MQNTTTHRQILQTNPSLHVQAMVTSTPDARARGNGRGGGNVIGIEPLCGGGSGGIGGPMVIVPSTVPTMMCNEMFAIAMMSNNCEAQRKHQ